MKEKEIFNNLFFLLLFREIFLFSAGEQYLKGVFRDDNS